MAKKKSTTKADFAKWANRPGDVVRRMLRKPNPRLALECRELGALTGLHISEIYLVIVERGS